MDEVEALIEAAKGNRYGHRDATIILLAFRHGLRASEVCDLRWDQVDFNGAVLHVRRVKNDTPSTHPIQGDELRALRRLQRESPTSPFVFVSERGSPFTTAGFARMIERAAAGADLEIKAHPHMLPHACGYALANKGHDTRAIQGWLGHRSITSTAVYTARRWRRTGSGTSGESDASAQRRPAAPYPFGNTRRFNLAAVPPGEPVATNSHERFATIFRRQIGADRDFDCYFGGARGRIWIFAWAKARAVVRDACTGGPVRHPLSIGGAEDGP
jgi:Phage integrase family